MAGGGSRTEEADTLETEAGDPFDSLLREAARISEPARPSAPTRLPIGTVLQGERFEIIRMLGSGGMGTVYEAFDRERAAHVALKTLNHLDAASIYQLKREFRALADLRHPNLIRLHELFAHSERWFFTMDRIEGVALDAWLSAASSGERLARLRSTLSQLTAAISAIHAAGKLHRDLKPGNVLVTADGRVIVLDFGLATAPEPGGFGRTIEREHISGTPGYMSPEQAAGLSGTEATDWYALGVILFEALCGRPPFDGRMLDVMVDKQRGAAPCVLTLAPAAPPDLAALCDQLLARAPADRPSGTRLREALSVEPAQRLSEVGRRSRLVGRGAESAALRAAFEASRNGRKPVVVLLAGESGIGKSALAHSLLDEVRAHAVVLSGRCFERERVPFKGFDGLVDDLSRHLRRLTHEEVLALLPRDTFALRRLFPVLGRIAPIAEAPEREVAEAHELRRRAFLALGELLGRIRDRTPLVVHLDDLQWSDADSTLLLMHVLRQPDAPQLLLIASHRSEHMDSHPCLAPLYTELPLDLRLDVRQLRLGPLDTAAAHALAAREVRSGVEALVAAAGGNPFLLEQLARHMGGHAGIDPTQLSLSVLVEQRISSLPPAERSLLEVIAVAGRPIALQLAAAACAVEAGALALFESLCTEHLARRIGEGLVVECFHDKIREGLVSLLPEATIAVRHGALARVLAATVDPDPEQLAGHLLASSQPTAAAENWLRAADRARRELGFERAARLYALALQHGQFEAATVQRLKVARAHALAEAGRGGAAADAFLEALEHAEAQDRTQLQHLAAEQLIYAGELDRGRELYMRVFDALGVSYARGPAAMVAAIAYHQTRLHLRRHRWKSRKEVNARDRARIDALRSASNALFRVDQARGLELGLRCALLALERGSERDAAIELSRLMLCNLLGGGASALSKASARAERLVAASQDVEIQVYFHMFRATAGIHAYNDVTMLNDLQRVIALSSEHAVAELSYHRTLAEWLLALARAVRGELATVAAELPARLDDAWSRSDLTVAPLWSGMVNVLCRLATEDLPALEHDLRKAQVRWSVREFTVQGLNLHDAQWRLDVYRGSLRAAYEETVQFHEQVSRSAMRRTLFARGSKRNRGLCAAALAAELPLGSERRALQEQVATLARAADQPLLRSAHACLCKDEETAIRELRAAPRHEWPTENYAMDRLLGVLVGGDEGQVLIDRADQFFRAAGVVDPARYAATLAPGLQITR